MRTKRKVINLFKDQDTHNIKNIISITCEDDLNNFWDFIANANNENEILIQTFSTQFYSLALNYILTKNAEFFEIILEDSEKYFYFTLWNKKVSRLFKKYSQKASLDFLTDKKRITIRLDKQSLKKSIKKIDKKKKKREEELIKSVTKPDKHTIKQAYTFINQHDLSELLALSEDMIEFSEQSINHGLNDDIYQNLRSTISLFCLTLRYYERIDPIANTLTKFSNLINVNQGKFLNLNKTELDLVDAFMHTINHWLNTVFVYGGADLYFMDNSIEADYQIIEQIINPNNNNFFASNIDDIFNF